MKTLSRTQASPCSRPYNDLCTTIKMAPTQSKFTKITQMELLHLQSLNCRLSSFLKFLISGFQWKCLAGKNLRNWWLAILSFLTSIFCLDRKFVQCFKVGIIKQLSGLDYRPISKLLCLLTSYWARLRLPQYDVTTHNNFDIGLILAR